MKIAVLNGSPKGDHSVTLQYARFIQQQFPEHEFETYNVAQRIEVSGDNDGFFNKVIDGVKTADAVCWAFPLYYLLVHSQYKRFIELVHEKDAADAFRGKYAAAIATSIHFFDHTALNYIRAVSEDLGMKFVGAHSAAMYDLPKPAQQKKLLIFAGDFFTTVAAGIPVVRQSVPLRHHDFKYLPGSAAEQISTGGKKVLVLSDARNENANLNGMIDRFRGTFRENIELINLYDINFKGGCRGCLECAYDNTCFYTGQDDYIDFYNSKVKTADIIIYAGTIHDRYLSARWKLYFDRSFFNTHQPTLRGKQIGYIVSGPLRQMSNMRQALDACVQTQQANLVDIITDEDGDAATLDGLLDNLAARAVRFAAAGYVRPSTFLGVAGWKLFRDELWGNLRFPFVADHNVYKKLGLYDFPRLSLKRRLRQRLMIAACRLPKFRKEVNRRMITAMVTPFRKLVGE